jgi:hypothetical protein
MEEFIVYKDNAPQIVYEVFDDEVVVLNLEKGHYYSLTETGVDIWDMIISGWTAGDIIQNLGRCYQGDPEDISFVVDQFLSRLLELEIIVQSPVEAIQTAGEGVIKAAKDSAVFVKPVLEIFTDMEELLLIDPVHEVDESGWPATAVNQDPDLDFD